ncbi:MAG: hypothetical protein GOV02_01205 [Candidatus Aenigmarchaeota archaeon]|nr:hypothetical protein [Candidatus Aenigmarchaeota archaeon]
MSKPDKEEFEVTNEAKFIASSLRSYPIWTDGYVDSSSYTWDSITKNINEAERHNLQIACIDIQNYLNSQYSKEIIERLNLRNENIGNYITSLEKISEILKN